jgi:CubicO group peptidase (beta-lactamase class C family)
MRIGSITKHFTALTFLLLCEDGEAQLDGPIGAYLPELHAVARGVTARQLLGHVSGLRDAFDLSLQFSGPGKSVSSAALLAFYHDLDDTNAAPGTTWSYNNGGYLLLSAAIEKIAGRKLEDIMRERIFEPLGMHNTLLRRWDTDFVSNSAALHMADSGGGFERSYLGMALGGEGGVVSTVDDMLLWLTHMDAPTVGGVSTWEAIKTPQWLANGTSTGYGLGLISERHRKVDVISHAGGVMGGNAQIVKVPSAGLDVVVMVNRQDVSAALLTNRILAACIPGLSPLENASQVSFATGTFRSPTTDRVIQLYGKDGQQIAAIDGVDLPVVASEDGALRPLPPFSFIKQSLTLTGSPLQPSSIRFCDFGNDDELCAQELMSGVEQRSIAGRYRSERTGTEAIIAEADGGLRLVTTGRYGSASYQLESLADSLWRAKSNTQVPTDGILIADHSRKAVHFSTPRTRALEFRRG